MKDGLQEKVTAQLHSFPAMPATVSRVLSLLRDPRVGAGEVERAIRYDPGLTANTLKLANSAYFGYSQKLASVRSAVVRLGWKRVYHLVIASCVNGVMSRPVRGYDLEAGELWRHGLAVSIAAEKLAEKLRLKAPEEAITAALLHDVGKLVLGEFVDTDFSEIEAAAARGVSFEAAEREVLGVDHAEIGARILERWLLPPVLVEVVRWHHNPDGIDNPSVILDVVHVADVLCLMLGIGTGREGLGYRPSERALSRLDLKTAHLEKVGSEILQDLEEVCQMLKGEKGAAAAR